jgi:hypothetical protein
LGSEIRGFSLDADHGREVPLASLLSDTPHSAKRIVSLDGLRAVSIAMVFVGHFWGGLGHSFKAVALESLAYSGVQVFFVISGFLITTLLLKEQERHGAVSLRSSTSGGPFESSRQPTLSCW